MWVCGIDPGLGGAIAATNGKTVTLFSIPTFKARSRGREVNWSECASNISLLPDLDHCFIERVGAMPRQGTASMFKFGYVCGGLRGIIAAKRIPVTMVTPPKWKKVMGIAGGSKDTARERACELFPDASCMFSRVKDDGRAEASLIALYGLWQLLGGSNDI